MDGDGKDAYVRELIRNQARKLIGKCGFTRSDRDDIEQELTIHCWQQREKFDPDRGQWSTFVNRVAGNRIASIIEYRQAAKRDYRREAMSLNQFVCDGNGERVELAQLMSDQDCHRLERRDEAAQRDLACDVRAFIVRLSPEDRELCQARQDHPPTEAARQLGISRGTLYDRIGKLRPLSEDAGLKEYL